LYFKDRKNAIEAYGSKQKSKLLEKKKTRRSNLKQRTIVADPDPHGSTFISVSWIRIPNADPDPGGPKLPTEVKKIQLLKCQMFSLRDEDFCCSLDFLYGGLGISKSQFLLKKYIFFICSNFWPSNPWIRIRIETNVDPQHCKERSEIEFVYSKKF
jgi:hypothetical protein